MGILEDIGSSIGNFFASITAPAAQASPSSQQYITTGANPSQDYSVSHGYNYVGSSGVTTTVVQAPIPVSTSPALSKDTMMTTFNAPIIKGNENVASAIQSTIGILTSPLVRAYEIGGLVGAAAYNAGADYGQRANERLIQEPQRQVVNLPVMGSAAITPPILVPDIPQGFGPPGTTTQPGQGTIRGGTMSGADYAGIQVPEVPVRPLTPQNLSTFYVPYGEREQIKVENAKALIDRQTGELGIYQTLYNPDTGKPRNIMNLASSGSRASAQSGMFSEGAALTPNVYEQSTGKYIGTPNLDIVQNPEKYSRLGAEAYGGYVSPLDERKVTSSTQLSRYPIESGNLANLVNPQGVNLSKAEAPGAKIPWTISILSPTIQYMDQTGIIGSPEIVGVSDRLIGGSKVASIAITGGGPVTSESGLKAPFISGGKSRTQESITMEGIQYIEGSPTLRPSDFSLETTRILGGGPVSAGVIGLHDFFFSPGDITTVKKGTPVESAAVTTQGEPYTVTKDLGEGKYEITTITPTTTKQEVSTPIIATTIPAISGFEHGEKQFSERVTGKYFPEMNPAKPTGNIALDYVAGYGRGAYEGLRTKPLTAMVNVGVGLLFVAGGELVAPAVPAFSSMAAGTRLAPVASGVEWIASHNIVPLALTGLYGYSVAERTTAGFKDVSPQAAERFGGITSTEILPMTGGALAFRPIYGGLRAQEIDIKAFAQENPKAGKTGYIKESLGEAVDAGSRPFRSVINDYLALKQEGYVKSPSEYAKMQLIDRPVNYLKAGIQELPGAMGQVSSGVGKVLTEPKPLTAANIGEKISARASTYPEGVVSKMAYGEPTFPDWFTRTTTVKSPDIGGRASLYSEGALGVEAYGEKWLPSLKQIPGYIKISALSFMQELRPSGMPTLGYVPKGGEGAPAIRRDIGGGSSDGRITTKTVGGKQVSGLKAESPLRSIGERGTGIIEEGATRDLSIGRSQDFRGRPVSETMKPMDLGASQTKQGATAIQIMTEPLPRLEPATVGTRALPRIPISPYFRMDVPATQQEIKQRTIQETRVIETTEPTFTILPINVIPSRIAGREISDIMRTERQARSQSMSQETISQQQEKQILSLAMELRPERIMKMSQESLRRQEFTDLQSNRDELRSAYPFDILTRITPITSITQRTDQRIITDFTQDTRTITRITPTIVVPPWLPELGRSALTEQLRMKNYFKFTEYLSFGSPLASIRITGSGTIDLRRLRLK